MKAQLNFDLENVEDLMDLKRCVQSTEMAHVIWELVHNSKKHLENAICSDTISRYDALDMVFEKINSLLDDNGIIIDKLIN